MSPKNQTLFLEGKYICVHCRRFNGKGCNTIKAKYVRTDCSRVTLPKSMCKCNHKGSFIK